MTEHGNWKDLHEGLELRSDSKAKEHVIAAYSSLTPSENGEGFPLRVIIADS